MTTRTPRFAGIVAATLAAGLMCGLTASTAAASTHEAPATPPAPMSSTLPTPPADLQFQGAKPGLLASDRLVVDATTGEIFGDEPVMLTMRIESVLGQAGSTKVSLVNNAPGEIASSVRAGREVGIQDQYGDAWFGVKPLSADDVISAIESKQPVPIPVVVTASVMLEGDLSNGGVIGQMGQSVAHHLQSRLAPELENTRIVMDDAGKPSGYQDALARITQAAKPDASLITNLVIQKVLDWGTAFTDPDDPVGVSLTALVPMDASAVQLIDIAGGPSALGLDDQYMKLDKVQVRTDPWDTDIEVRTGLLVPPSELGGKEQSWWTTYSGDYLYDDPVSYRVWTHAWPQISW